MRRLKLTTESNAEAFRGSGGQTEGPGCLKCYETKTSLRVDQMAGEKVGPKASPDVPGVERRLGCQLVLDQIL